MAKFVDARPAAEDDVETSSATSAQLENPTPDVALPSNGNNGDALADAFAAPHPRGENRPAMRGRWIVGHGRRCFFYVATGDRYRAEAVASVQSLRAHMPHAHVVLYADRETHGPFDETVIIESPLFSRGAARSFSPNWARTGAPIECASTAGGAGSVPGA